MKTAPMLCLCAAIFLVACQSSRAPYCAISSPIRLSAETVDRMSDQEVAAVLAHNEKLQKLCGVKP